MISRLFCILTFRPTVSYAFVCFLAIGISVGETGQGKCTQAVSLPLIRVTLPNLTFVRSGQLRPLSKANFLNTLTVL